MSLPSQHTITCGGCGRRQAFTMWDSLNVSLNRDLKAELLRGELTRFVCAGCGWSGDVFYPMLYHDMEQKVMIHLCAPQGEPESLGSGGLPQMERFLEGYRFRLVNTRNELREKILIFDAGLDDGLLECLKCFMRAQMAGCNRPLAGELLFAGTSEAPGGGRVIRLEHLTAGVTETVDLPLAALTEVGGYVAGRLPTAGSDARKWLRVDADYAGALIGSVREDEAADGGST